MSVDLSHHVNAHSRGRHPSPLKDIVKYMGVDKMISIAGGLPHPSLFPFDKATIQAATPDASGRIEISLENNGHPETVQVAKILQYGTGAGHPELVQWCHDFTNRVFKPAYDFKVLLNDGSTDGWCKVVRLLCSPGDLILCEEHTFPTAQAVWIPLGCQAVPIKMDAIGMRADHLGEVLDSWTGEKKPHIMYIVPVGSNPTGSTMTAERRKEIYDICVKHDIIICEDDPYSFLQYPKYGQTTSKSTPEDFIQSLAPSFLKYDYQGRVIRLDTFSKTLGPGNRLGYFVTNAQFYEGLLRATEIETQDPSGWSQGIVMGLLRKWGSDGYLTWLAQLQEQYRIRRDWMCDAISKSFDVKDGVVFAKGTSTALFSYVPPSGGMFIWAKFDFTSNPRFLELQDEEKFEAELWMELIEALILLVPGSYYTPWQGTKVKGEKGIGHFRLAFSMITKEQMEDGIERMAKVLSKSWGL